MSAPLTVTLPGAVHSLPFSPALVWGGLVFVSGQVGKHPVSDAFAEDIDAQTRQTLSNIKALLEAAGTSLDKALRMTIYMTDMQNEFAAMNAVFKEFFHGALPARSTVGISHLAKPGLKIEIDLVAYKD
ncbi:RidA family protein [Bordetella avium]|uniref:Endoribonuclease n=1 Tax=Bordetella avium (strain 197N) TaxID=360910 RepID=Q2L316_BORA1|nr:RidA family protein [Bordetella avium]RIQ54572.1 RidA family protein [Bordetella avium]RIQ70932.1 RidA family protein [Bordetella avium]CAJ48873.1 putative endoribonuclease [Bordetella avium 197N]